VRRIIALALLLAAACSSGNPVMNADFQSPSAVVAFWGAGTTPGVLTPWIAVASTRGDQLRLIDPVTDEPARSANPAFPLSVPTLERPLYLASGSMSDGGADVLAVATTGTVVQLVGTWFPPFNGVPGYAIAQSWELSAEVPEGSVIVGLAVTPVPGTPWTGTVAGADPVAGKAWLIVAFSEGRSSGGMLIVLELARADDGSIALAAEPAAKPIPFVPATISGSPDNIHVYCSTADFILDAQGVPVQGVAEFSVGAGLAAPWPVRGLDGRGPTSSVAAAIVGERTVGTWWDFQEPVLRIYAALDSSGCGAGMRIACGIATFDPARGGLAADPAPPTGFVPRQSYRTPMTVSATPFGLAIAMPPAHPNTTAPGQPFGSQVCYSPADSATGLAPCPDAGLPGGGFALFNGGGVGQRFMEMAASSVWWTTAIALVAGSDGYPYVQDLGRFGPPDAISALNDATQATACVRAVPIGPAGPVAGSQLLGFPAGTSAVGLKSSKDVVDSDPAFMVNDVIVWPGFTKSDTWLVQYQGLLPGLSSRKGVLGLAADDATLFLAIQQSYAPPPSGILPAASPWIPLAVVASPEFAIHPAAGNPMADISQFYLDVDPCTPTRPNWVPAGGGAAVYDPTRPPQTHEAPVGAFLPPDPVRYPGGALALAVPDDPTLASEYQCLVDALRASPGTVLTAFNNVQTSTTDYLRGIWVRAGGFVLTGSATGYAGRPVMGVRYNFAWADEDSLSAEDQIVARKARRFWYPAFYDACEVPGCYFGFPEMTDPMEPGPVVGFTLGRYCQSGITPDGCDPVTSPPARDAGVSFTTRSGFVPTVRRPTSASVGTSVTTFDKSLLPGYEWRGRVFYTSFVGGVLFDVPPGLDSGQTVTIR